MRKTKILVTIGPVTDTKEKIRELIKTGVNAFRLNFSHGDHETHGKNVKLIREVADEEKVIISILQDISGPKVRIGEVDGILELKIGDKIKLSKVENLDDPKHLILSYPSIIDRIDVGNEIYFADGTVRTKVVDKDSDTLVLELLVNGELSSRKGVNFPDIEIGIPAITPKDEKDLAFGATLGVDVVALSFVHNKEDIKTAKKILAEHHSHPLIVAKIETMAAVENLEEIIHECGGVMVARGDLGAELGTHRVPAIQRKIIKIANQTRKTAIVATQMLSSMVHAPFPTRAEASDVANAVYDGADVVMLSDETTIGNYPVEAVKVLVDTILETEKDYDYYKNYEPTSQDIFANSAVNLAHYLKGTSIVTFTSSGFIAKSVSRYRPSATMYAITHDDKTLRQLNMFWGVKPLFTIERSDSTVALLRGFIKSMRKLDLINKDSNFVITKGTYIGKQGTTNSIRSLDYQGILAIENDHA